MNVPPHRQMRSLVFAIIMGSLGVVGLNLSIDGDGESFGPCGECRQALAQVFDLLPLTLVGKTLVVNQCRDLDAALLGVHRAIVEQVGGDCLGTVVS